jgi:RNA polymerase sigma factor (sigma-70 family)
MTTSSTNVVLRHIREVVAAQNSGHLSDQQLLQRFLTDQEEAAFAGLVRRHGTLVLGVCRRVLHNLHDAEDAFQATFLILARRAASIQKQESLGSWLHGVAYRVALKARTRTANRKQHELKEASGLVANSLADVKGSELVEALDEELQHLPQRLKAPLVLCYLEGRTRDEAAVQLGWSVSTLRRRLEQGRDLLRSRLVHRGLTLPAALLTAAMTASADAPVPAALAVCTIRAGVQSAAGSAGIRVGWAQSVGLAEGVLQSLAVSKLKVATVCMLLAGVAALAIGAFTPPAGAPRAEGTAAAEASAPDGTERLRPGPPVPDKGKSSTAQTSPNAKQQLTVTGRVLAASGKPLAGSHLAVLIPDGLAVSGQSDAQGRFRLHLPIARVKELGPNPTLTILALARGYGVGWEAVQVKTNQAEVAFRLTKEEPLRGRLIDLQGVAAAGVKLHLRSVSREPTPGFKGISSYVPADGSPLWPAFVTTDKEGYFLLHGLKAGMSVAAHVNDDRFALQDLSWEGGVKAPAALVLAPPRWIEGQVVYGDTRKPVSGVEVTVNGGGTGRFVNGKFVEEESLKVQVVHTDKEGQFRCNHYARHHYHFSIKPPPRIPYFMSTFQSPIDWSGNLKVKHTVVLPLKRGVLQTGKVVDADTGKPVAGAQIYYVPQAWSNPLLKGAPEDFWGKYHGIADTDSDGTFAVAVLPGPGHLRIRKHPWHDHVKYGISAGRLIGGKDEGEYWYDHAWVKLDIKLDIKPAEVVAKIQREVRIPGQLTGPDDNPVAKVSVLVLSISDGRHREVPVAIDAGGPGRFELRGGDPAVTYRVLFFDSQTQSGAVAEIAGKQPAGKTLTVTLKPYGSAVARFVDAKGKGIEKHQPRLEIQETIKGENGKSQTVRLTAPVEKGGLVTDAEGRCRFTNLVPGVTYIIPDGNGTRTFGVESGKKVDLGTVQVSAGK